MDGVTQPREIVPSPPATFPVYGLDASWTGSRWLDGFGDRIGDEVRWVRLSHQDPDTGALIAVQTFSRSLTDAQAARSGERPLQAVAFAAAVVLVNMTLPAPSAPRPPGILRELVSNAHGHSGQYAEWPTVPWRVDGLDAGARMWRFAGGWAAVSDSMGGVYLAAAAWGTGPDGLALTRLANGRAYGFDLAQPLDPRAVAASSAARAGGERLPPQRPDWHADQLRLVAG
jgi:hypothetical protein